MNWDFTEISPGHSVDSVSIRTSLSLFDGKHFSADQTTAMGISQW